MPKKKGKGRNASKKNYKKKSPNKNRQYSKSYSHNRINSGSDIKIRGNDGNDNLHDILNEINNNNSNINSNKIINNDDEKLMNDGHTKNTDTVILNEAAKKEIKNDVELLDTLDENHPNNAEYDKQNGVKNGNKVKIDTGDVKVNEVHMEVNGGGKHNGASKQNGATTGHDSNQNGSTNEVNISETNEAIDDIPKVSVEPMKNNGNTDTITELNGATANIQTATNEIESSNNDNNIDNNNEMPNVNGNDTIEPNGINNEATNDNITSKGEVNWTVEFAKDKIPNEMDKVICDDPVVVDVTPKNNETAVELDDHKNTMDENYKPALSSGIFGQYPTPIIQEPESTQEVKEEVLESPGIEMPDDYKPSLGSGIFGQYPTKIYVPIESIEIKEDIPSNQEMESTVEVKMDENYKPSLNSGIFGGYPSKAFTEAKDNNDNIIVDQETVIQREEYLPGTGIPGDILLTKKSGNIDQRTLDELKFVKSEDLNDNNNEAVEAVVSVTDKVSDNVPDEVPDELKDEIPTDKTINAKSNKVRTETVLLGAGIASEIKDSGDGDVKDVEPEIAKNEVEQEIKTENKASDAPTTYVPYTLETKTYCTVNFDKKYTLFEITIKSGKSVTKRWHRFSQMYKFYESISNKYNDAPKFPSKHIFVFSQDDAFLKTRMSEFNEFFKKLIKFIDKRHNVSNEIEKFLKINITDFYGDIHAINYFIKKNNKNKDFQDKSGSTVLHYCVAFKKISILQILLNRHNVNTNIKDYYGFTPLLLAKYMANKYGSNEYKDIQKKLESCTESDNDDITAGKLPIQYRKDLTKDKINVFVFSDEFSGTDKVRNYWQQGILPLLDASKIFNEINYIHQVKKDQILKHCKNKLKKSCDIIVGIGGDKILNEIANGIINQNNEITVCILPCGLPGENTMSKELNFNALIEGVKALVNPHATALDGFEIQHKNKKNTDKHAGLTAAFGSLHILNKDKYINTYCHAIKEKLVDLYWTNKANIEPEPGSDDAKLSDNWWMQPNSKAPKNWEFESAEFGVLYCTNISYITDKSQYTRDKKFKMNNGFLGLLHATKKRINLDDNGYREYIRDNGSLNSKYIMACNISECVVKINKDNAIYVKSLPNAFNIIV